MTNQQMQEIMDRVNLKKARVEQGKARAQATTATENGNETAIIENEITAEIVESEYNFVPITDFQADLKGAERLFWKSVKLINRYANIRPNEWDKQDCISAIYIAVMTTEPKDDDTELSEIAQKYFGIRTRQQFRNGYNAVQRIIYATTTRGNKVEYSQEYGLDGTHAKDEIAEIELDLTLQAILSEQFQEYLEKKLQGYTVTEIAEMLNISVPLAKKWGAEIRGILKDAFNVDTTNRKVPRIK